MDKPRIAVHKFTSCDGCQLQFLNLEQELLTLGERVEIAHFIEASSILGEGNYDISFVEGSVSTHEEVERIKAIRAQSKVVVSIGACGQAGGIQALRNWANFDDYVRGTYAHPEYIDSLANSTPFSDHIEVDHVLAGCPPDQGQLKYVITSLLAGALPRIPGEAVCLKCKRDGNVCVLVAENKACMGPITRTGCGALCPHQERDCYGCFGPQEGPNITALGRRFLGLGLKPSQVVERLRFIYSWDPGFRNASNNWEIQGESYSPLPPQKGKGGIP